MLKDRSPKSVSTVQHQGVGPAAPPGGSGGISLNLPRFLGTVLSSGPLRSPPLSPLLPLLLGIPVSEAVRRFLKSWTFSIGAHIRTSKPQHRRSLRAHSQLLWPFPAPGGNPGVTLQGLPAPVHSPSLTQGKSTLSGFGQPLGERSPLVPSRGQARLFSFSSFPRSLPPPAKHSYSRLRSLWPPQPSSRIHGGCIP